MINVAVMGYGTVGSGVVEVLEKNKDVIAKRVGEEVCVKYVLDLRDFPGDPVQEKVVHDFEIVVNDPEVAIVVETMGGIEPAYTFVKRSLLAGKGVATSNKALVEKRGTELLAIAREKNLNFLFEASVGGGIPILRPLMTSLTADVIEEIGGILNGTTNYMLTKMYDMGVDYDVVLKEAQDKGYAERNPEADVEGYDTGRKIAILCSLVTGKKVDFEDIYTEGITKVSKEDMAYARSLGMHVKLLASAKRHGDKMCVMVAPVMMGREHPLYAVDDVFNAVFVRGNMLGDAMFYGSGAGKLPTASAVVADVVEAAKNPSISMMGAWSEEKEELLPPDAISRRFFVRMPGDAREKLPAVKESFGSVTLVEVEGLDGEFGFLSEEMTEGEYAKCAERFPEILHRLRIEG
ncbi:MAG: homoserine dehydrogenase [Ruminococcus sp.]|nr:homoserine dehydrogenase [Ruminococcus sp.]